MKLNFTPTKPAQKPTKPATLCDRCVHQVSENVDVCDNAKKLATITPVWFLVEQCSNFAEKT